MSKTIEPMDVKRIETEHGSHIEPAYRNSWPEGKRLAWKLGVTLIDHGLHLTAHDSNSSTKILGKWVRNPGTSWNLAATGRGWVISSGSFDETWSNLTFLGMGYELGNGAK